MNDFRVIFDKLKLFYGVSTDKKVAEKLNINYNTVKTWGNRKKVALEKLLDSLQNETIDINWLLKGEESNINQNGNNNINVNGNNGHINIHSNKTINDETYKELQKLTTKKQEYFYHLIKAETLKES